MFLQLSPYHVISIQMVQVRTQTVPDFKMHTCTNMHTKKQQQECLSISSLHAYLQPFSRTTAPNKSIEVCAHSVHGDYCHGDSTTD